VPTTLTGGSCANAQRQLESVGLKGTCHGVQSTPAQKDSVVRTDPGGGSSVSSGSTVQLYVGDGPSTVNLPNLVGKRYQDATTEITSLGLPQPVVKFVTSAKQPNNYVAYTQPGAGTVPASKEVTLYVSNGNVLMPDVTGGLTCGQASQKLSAKTLKPTCQPQSDPKIPAGQVIGVLNYAPGTPVPQGTSVTVQVSSGPGSAVIPNVVGENGDQARSQLKGDGFKVFFFTPDVTCTANLDGVVESQRPGGGTSAQQGTYVGLKEWRYKPNDPSCQNGGSGTSGNSTSSTT
jgi:eukaryotic-like serine/threonine-protein kinase